MSVFDLKKISELPATATINDADIVVLVQGGVTKRTVWAVLKNALSGAPSGATFVTEVTVDGAESAVFASGIIIQSIVFTGSDGPVKVGTTDGGDELVLDAIDGKPLVYSILPDPFYPSGVTLYFEGDFTAKIFAWSL